MKGKNSRRITLSLLVVVSAVALGGVSFAQSPSSSANTTNATNATTNGDWSTYRADNGLTGATNGTGPSGPYADIDWHADPGHMSGAVVEGDTVYVGSTTASDTNYENGEVVAYDAQTGDVRWKRTEFTGVDSLTMANGTLYASSDAITDTDYVRDDSGTPGLFALDPKTGETKWRSNASKMWGQPIVVGDTVYILGSEGYGSTNETVYAIDAETGRTEDSYEIDLSADDRDVLRGVHSYTVIGDTAYLSIATGTEVDNGNDYVGDYDYNGTLIALNTSDWSREWTANIDSEPVGLSVSDGNVYWTAEHDEVYSFAADDGTQRWHVTLDNGVEGSEADTVTAPAVANGTVYVGTDDDYVADGEGQSVGTVHALDADDGSVQWRFDARADVSTAPTVTNDTVYIGGNYATEATADNIDNLSHDFSDTKARHVAYALNRVDGSERWSYAVNGSAENVVVDGIVPANDHLYMLVVDEYVYPQYAPHQLYALNASDQQPNKYHRLADDSVNDSSGGSDDGSNGNAGDDSSGSCTNSS